MLEVDNVAITTMGLPSNEEGPRYNTKPSGCFFDFRTGLFLPNMCISCVVDEATGRIRTQATRKRNQMKKKKNEGLSEVMKEK